MYVLIDGVGNSCLGAGKWFSLLQEIGAEIAFPLALETPFEPILDMIFPIGFEVRISLMVLGRLNDGIIMSLFCCLNSA